MIISTTNLDQDYEVIDVVYVRQSAVRNPRSRDINPYMGFEKTKELLAAKAEELGGDAVIGVDFKERDGDFHAFGTAVKLK